MAYCVQSDLERKISLAELVQLTDDSHAGTVDTTVIATAIDEADTLINSYVGKVKMTPLSPVPGLIKNLSATLAIWYLFVRRSTVDAVRQKAYDDAVKTLQSIALGTVTLGVEEATVLPETTEGGPASSTSIVDRVFTNDTLSGF